MKTTTRLLLNTAPPPPPCSILPIQCWQITEQLCSQTLKSSTTLGQRAGKEGKRRLKVVAFPTLVTISSDFSMLSDMLF